MDAGEQVVQRSRNLCEVYLLKDGSFNLGIATIGVSGKAALNRIIRDPEYASERFNLEALKAGEPCRQIRQMNGYFPKCDYCWMFVLADLGEEGALDVACAFAENYCQEKEHELDKVILVTMDDYMGTQLIQKAEAAFDKMFLVESVNQLHLPIVLFRNIESEYGFIGIDYADVTVNFQHAKKIYVSQEVYSNMMKAISLAEAFLIRQEEKQKRLGCQYGNLCIIGSYDSNVSLVDIESLIDVHREGGYGDLVVHAVFNTQETDTSETVIVFNCVN